MMFMDMAEVAARRSTCFRGNIGALIVSGTNIYAMGYNGPPSGHPHCAGQECQLGPTGGCARSAHAEDNAIQRAGSMAYGADLYCTSSPCERCAEKIIMFQLGRVFYRHPYRSSAGLQKLLQADIPVYRVTPAGYIVSELTGDLIDPRSL